MSRWLLLLALSITVLPLTVFAQEYPARPVRLLVGFPPGGAMDTIVRVLAPRLSDSLGQPFIVENRAGAGGALAADTLVRAPADGYVLLLAESGTLIVPALNSKVTYDPVKQFAAVAGVCTLPLALVTSNAFPIGTVPELIETLKAHPNAHSYASPGVGTLQHLAFELFMHSTGTRAVHVPYKGAGAMMPDLMSGQVHIGIVSAPVAVAQSRAGKIRALAVTSPQRLPIAPDIPALAETVPGFEAAPNVFVVAPAGTPPYTVARLSTAIRAALRSRPVVDVFLKQGASATPAEPAELAARIAAETRGWAAVVKDAGIKPE
jgi:tripartite-type tricarboxylate transporter receptor subunit TctC